ncbi:hypothetical protein TWF730_010609 [Orbilia blumenaviensis]|uniref:Uncharacterized protein n=1 Tax=Orbilia blumenaviensis TaxID=1796055 RepID=A0AAV9UPJ3_9PEZI
MCTEYECWFECGHPVPYARKIVGADGKVAEAYGANWNNAFPTGIVTKHCPKFLSSGDVCPVQDRMIITERWPALCPDSKTCQRITKFDDDNCPLLQQDSLKFGDIKLQKKWKNLSEKRRAEHYKNSARINQPPVWGRKGPHTKKPRNVKTKDERERERESKGRTRDRTEVDERDLVAARTLANLASWKPKSGRKKADHKVDIQQPTEKNGKKRGFEVIEDDTRLGSEPVKKRTKKDEKPMEAMPKPAGKKKAESMGPEPKPKEKVESKTKRGAPKDKAISAPTANLQTKGRRRATDAAGQKPEPAPKRQRKETRA